MLDTALEHVHAANFYSDVWGVSLFWSHFWSYAYASENCPHPQDTRTLALRIWPLRYDAIYRRRPMIDCTMHYIYVMISELKWDRSYSEVIVSVLNFLIFFVACSARRGPLHGLAALDNTL